MCEVIVVSTQAASLRMSADAGVLSRRTARLLRIKLMERSMRGAMRNLEG